jgi:hypothetical protein
MKVEIMATQNTRPIRKGALITQLLIVLYGFITLGLVYVTHNANWLWAFMLITVFAAAHMRVYPEMWPAHPHSPSPYEDPYLVNVGIGGTAANEVYKLNLEIQQLRQELERMKYK